MGNHNTHFLVAELVVANGVGVDPYVGLCGLLVGEVRCDNKTDNH